MGRAASSVVLPKIARLTHGNQVTDVQVTQLDSTKAAFLGTPGMAAKFARMAFKLGDAWFDVEGVVMARFTGSSACMCQLMFSAMTACETARLDQALQAGPGGKRAELGHPARRQMSLGRTPQIPISGSNDARKLFAEALRDMAV